MQFVELKQHLALGQPRDAYLIVGEDAFLRMSAADMFKKLVSVMPELNLSIITDAKDDVAIIEAVNVLPLLANRRVVIVENYTASLERVVKYLANPNPSTVLVFIADSLTANFNKAASMLTPIECDRLDFDMLKKWIGNKLKGSNTAITVDGANTLIEYCAKSLTRIDSELGKLMAYKMGGEITSADVRELVSADIEVKIFEISEALSNKNGDKVSVVLSSLLSSGTPVVNIMGLLYSHFRRLLYVSVTPQYATMASDLCVKEYAVKKAKEQAQKFSAKRLKAICDSFHRADYDFKTGKISAANALDVFILETLSA